jgi:hypothetical protein
MLTRSSEAALEAHSVREQIEKILMTASPELKPSLEKADEMFTAFLSGKTKSAGSEEAPGLDDVAGDVSALYTQIGQVDAAPTVAQRTAAGHVNEELSAVMGAWEPIKSTSIPELNDKLRREHLSPLDLNQKPETMPQSGDED